MTAVFRIQFDCILGEFSNKLGMLTLDLGMAQYLRIINSIADSVAGPLTVLIIQLVLKSCTGRHRWKVSSFFLVDGHALDDRPVFAGIGCCNDSQILIENLRFIAQTNNI